MNANELADKLLDSLTMEYDCDKYMEQAATMLRQQAKELAEAGGMIGVLREYISDLEKGLDSSINLNKAQAERNNEPVIWTACLDCGKRVTGDSIHTCSPQTKPLSDDEIEQLREYHGINDWLYETSVTDFARAIEERHGIK